MRGDSGVHGSGDFSPREVDPLSDDDNVLAPATQRQRQHRRSDVRSRDSVASSLAPQHVQVSPQNANAFDAGFVLTLGSFELAALDQRTWYGFYREPVLEKQFLAYSRRDEFSPLTAMLVTMGILHGILPVLGSEKWETAWVYPLLITSAILLLGAGLFNSIACALNMCELPNEKRCLLHEAIALCTLACMLGVSASVEEAFAAECGRHYTPLMAPNSTEIVDTQRNQYLGCRDGIAAMTIGQLGVTVFFLNFRPTVTLPPIWMAIVILALSNLWVQAASTATFWIRWGYTVGIGALLSGVAVRNSRREREHFATFLKARVYAARAIETRSRLDATLRALLPVDVVAAMASGEQILDISERTTISVCDVYDFVHWSLQFVPKTTVEVLNVITALFDEEVSRQGLRKVKSLGDRYITSTKPKRSSPQDASKLRVSRSTAAPMSHTINRTSSDAASLLWFALYQQYIATVVSERLGDPIEFHIAVHTGHCFGAVVGTTSVSYEVFGEAILVAQNLVTLAPASEIVASEATLEEPGVLQAVAPIPETDQVTLDLPVVKEIVGYRVQLYDPAVHNQQYPAVPDASGSMRRLSSGASADFQAPSTDTPNDTAAGIDFSSSNSRSRRSSNKSGKSTGSGKTNAKGEFGDDVNSFSAVFTATLNNTQNSGTVTPPVAPLAAVPHRGSMSSEAAVRISTLSAPNSTASEGAKQLRLPSMGGIGSAPASAKSSTSMTRLQAVSLNQPSPMLVVPPSVFSGNTDIAGTSFLARSTGAGGGADQSASTRKMSAVGNSLSMLNPATQNMMNSILAQTMRSSIGTPPLSPQASAAGQAPASMMLTSMVSQGASVIGISTTEEGAAAMGVSTAVIDDINVELLVEKDTGAEIDARDVRRALLRSKVKTCETERLAEHVRLLQSYAAEANVEWGSVQQALTLTEGDTADEADTEAKASQADPMAVARTVFEWLSLRCEEATPLDNMLFAEPIAELAYEAWHNARHPKRTTMVSAFTALLGVMIILGTMIELGVNGSAKSRDADSGLLQFELKGSGIALICISILLSGGRTIWMAKTTAAHIPRAESMLSLVAFSLLFAGVANLGTTIASADYFYLYVLLLPLGLYIHEGLRFWLLCLLAAAGAAIPYIICSLVVKGFIFVMNAVVIPFAVLFMIFIARTREIRARDVFVDDTVGEIELHSVSADLATYKGLIQMLFPPHAVEDAIEHCTARASPGTPAPVYLRAISRAVVVMIRLDNFLGTLTKLDPAAALHVIERAHHDVEQALSECRHLHLVGGFGDTLTIVGPFEDSSLGTKTSPRSSAGGSGDHVSGMTDSHEEPHTRAETPPQPAVHSGVNSEQRHSPTASLPTSMQRLPSSGGSVAQGWTIVDVEGVLHDALQEGAHLLGLLLDTKKRTPFTAVVVTDMVLATITGRIAPSFTAAGVAIRQARALVEAAPTGFVGASEQFVRACRDANLSPDEHFGASEQWAVRGAGRVRLHPYLQQNVGSSTTAPLCL